MTIALTALLPRLPASAQVIGPPDATFSSVEIDSRKVTPGALFVALRGEHVDGHAFVAQAIANGAKGVVVELGHDLDARANVTTVLVPDTRRALSAIAAAFYADPSQALDVVGITGTNGKTTTAHMVAGILNEAGRPCGVIGTVGALFGRWYWDVENTTPLPNELHGLLAKMRELGAKAAAIEVSSHALALDRVEDVRFRVGVLTNVTRDHLDFHQTLEAYAAAKHRLFAMAETAVINLDDEHGVRWLPEIRRRIPTLTYSLHGHADLVPQNLEIDAHESRFTLDGATFTVRVPGGFNVSNALAAIGAARLMRIGDETIERALHKLTTVSGRMEYVGDGIVNVVVDYAHTPDALHKALHAMRKTTRGLAVVFGCGGDRDKGKRAEMGRVAAEQADRIYVTSDNPRHEDPMAIIAAIEEGIGSAPHVVEQDRRAAIERAIFEASVGDVVLIAGKGHEKTQTVGDAELPFDDVEVAREALRARRKRK